MQINSSFVGTDLVLFGSVERDEQSATRNTGFRFQNGQFAMIGLEIDGRPLMRAYSMASANHEEELEFF